MNILVLIAFFEFFHESNENTTLNDSGLSVQYLQQSDALFHGELKQPTLYSSGNIPWQISKKLSKCTDFDVAQIKCCTLLDAILQVFGNAMPLMLSKQSLAQLNPCTEDRMLG